MQVSSSIDLSTTSDASPRALSRARAQGTDKPLLRGVSHQIAFFFALGATAFLVAIAPTARSTAAAVVFGGSLAFLFGTSALYHRVQWTTEQRQRMRRVDHAAIFILIAGGYTPLFALVPSSAGGHGALALVWIGATLGVLKSLVWAHAPKWVTAALCVGLGWTAAGQAFDRMPQLGSLNVGLLVLSGFVYSVGAVVYALKRPDPFPKTFGYHEIFHAMVVLASVSLFGHVVLVLRSAQAGW